VCYAVAYPIIIFGGMCYFLEIHPLLLFLISIFFGSMGLPLVLGILICGILSLYIPFYITYFIMYQLYKPSKAKCHIKITENSNQILEDNPFFVPVFDETKILCNITNKNINFKPCHKKSILLCNNTFGPHAQYHFMPLKIFIRKIKNIDTHDLPYQFTELADKIIESENALKKKLIDDNHDVNNISHRFGLITHRLLVDTNMISKLILSLDEHLKQENIGVSIVLSACYETRKAHLENGYTVHEKINNITILYKKL
jgi:hypothetical protein